MTWRGRSCAVCVAPRPVLPENYESHLGARGDEHVWSVFDTSGRFLADVPMPADLTVYDIGRDWILSGWRDEMDVEYVRLDVLERTPSTQPSTR